MRSATLSSTAALFPTAMPGSSLPTAPSIWRICPPRTAPVSTACQSTWQLFCTAEMKFQWGMLYFVSSFDPDPYHGKTAVMPRHFAAFGGIRRHGSRPRTGNSNHSTAWKEPTAPSAVKPAALWRRGRKHRILMSKCHLQGKSPGPNAARGRNHFGSIAGKL